MLWVYVSGGSDGWGAEARRLETAELTGRLAEAEGKLEAAMRERRECEARLERVAQVGRGGQLGVWGSSLCW